MSTDRPGTDAKGSRAALRAERRSRLRARYSENRAAASIAPSFRRPGLLRLSLNYRSRGDGCQTLASHPPHPVSSRALARGSVRNCTGRTPEMAGGLLSCMRAPSAGEVLGQAGADFPQRRRSVRPSRRGLLKPEGACATEADGT